MARISWKTRFASMLANPLLVGRDRTFIESLHRHWSSGKSMTRGRKFHFLKMEEKLERLAKAEPKDGALAERINRVMARAGERSWARGFCESLASQNLGGRDLSDKQLATLDKIEAEHSDDALSARVTWATDYATKHRATAIKVAKYYQTGVYFGDLVRKILNDGEFVPTMKQYNAMTGNKYAKKVLAGYEVAPKYAAGSYVTIRSTTPSNERWPNGVGRGKRLDGATVCIVLGSSEDIISACAGNKRYKLLPVGAAQTVILEERRLKKARGLKK
jgi:hypothetical protein